MEAHLIKDFRRSGSGSAKAQKVSISFFEVGEVQRVANRNQPRVVSVGTHGLKSVIPAAQFGRRLFEHLMANGRSVFRNDFISKCVTKRGGYDDGRIGTIPPAYHALYLGGCHSFG